jgi:hypothetical protein
VLSGAGLFSGAFVLVVGIEDLLMFSFSLSVARDALGFKVCFEAPPKTLLRMFHFPLPVSSSGKSCSSIDRDEVGRVSGSGGIGLVGEGFLWWGFWTTPSNDRNGPLLERMGLSLRMIRKRRPGAGLQAVVDEGTACLLSASSWSQR